jgi:hypothetical protein
MVPLVPVILCLLPLPIGAALYRSAEKRSRVRWTAPALPEAKDKKNLQGLSQVPRQGGGPYRGEMALVQKGEAAAPMRVRRAAAIYFATGTVATSASLAVVFAVGWLGVLALPLGMIVAYASIRAGYNVLDGRKTVQRDGGMPAWMAKALERKRARLPAG